MILRVLHARGKAALKRTQSKRCRAGHPTPHSRSVWTACASAPLFGVFLAQSIFAATHTNLYVSPTGSGTVFSLAQPGNLFAARDVVRTLTPTMTGDIVVNLLGGTYTLTNSFQLREGSVHDSGTGGFNVIYRAAPGEVPVLSGGLTVTNWSLFDAGKNIWRANVGLDVNSRQLYVNGVRAIRARGPLNPSGFSLNGGTGFFITNTNLQSWANQTNIEIVCRNAWKHLRCPVASITGTNIVMQTPGWTLTGNSPQPGRPWNGNGHRSLGSVTWVENAYELLSGPGMWYLNHPTGYLYYIPRPGENLATAVVTLPVVEKLVDAAGESLSTPLHNVIFSGITFSYATWLLPGTSLGYPDNQTGILWPGATGALKTPGNVSFQTASTVQLTNNVFTHLGGVAIDFGGGAHSNTIAGNRIEDISSCGVTVGEATDYATTDARQMTDGNVIQDNWIRCCGQDYEDCIGIWIGYAKNTLIAHNDMDNFPYSAISLGWGWGTTSYATGNRVVGNIAGSMMQTLSDGGACYSLSAQTNSWQIGNWLHDSGYHGIYWDEGSSYFTAVSNVFDNCGHDYIHIHSSGNTKNDQFDTATNNFSNTTAASDAATAGSNCVITNTTFVTADNWPALARTVIANAGLEPAYASIKPAEVFVNSDEPLFDHVPGGWTRSTARGFGDYRGDVHYTKTDGQYLQYTFTSTAISWLGEMNTDLGNVEVYLDGVLQSTVNCYNTTRVAQQRLFTAANLSGGPHTLKLLKNGGTYMMVDAFVIAPTNFWIAVAPNAATASAGTSVSALVKLDTFIGYSASVVLSVSGLPANSTASFSPPTLSGPGFATMTVNTASNTTPAGVYPLAISGVGGAVTNLALMNLTVTPTPVPPPPVTNDTFTVASQNAYGLRSAGTTVEDSREVLQVKRLADSNTRISYVRFPLGDFLAHHASSNISSAMLRLWVPTATSGGGTLSVYGLIDNFAGTNGSDGVWSSTTLTWNNQPAKSAAPNDIPGSSTALPNANTTALLGSAGIPSTATNCDVPLSVPDVISFLNADRNQQVTLLFVNSAATIVSFASVSNTSGYIQPALELVAPVSRFSLAVAPSNQTVSAGSNATFTVAIAGTNGFTGDVTLSAITPAGVTADFEPDTINGSGTSTLTLTTATDLRSANFAIPITAASDAVQSNCCVTLTVNALDTDGDGIPDWWTGQYFGHPAGEAGDQTRAQDDFDDDGQSNLAEFLSGTDPGDAQSCLRVLSVTLLEAGEGILWTTVGGHSYVVQAASELNAFTDVSPLISDSGSGESTTNYVEPGGATNGVRFYRVRLGP